MLNVLCVGRSKSELSIFSWRELTQSGYFYFWHTKTWDILSPTYHRPTHIPTNLPIYPPSWTTRTLSKSDHRDLWIHKHSCLNRVMSRPLGNRRKIYGKEWPKRLVTVQTFVHSDEERRTDQPKKMVTKTKTMTATKTMTKTIWA